MKKRNLKNFILDSWALLAFFKKEPCFSKIEFLFRRAEKEEIKLFLCLINWGEIYYKILRHFGKDKVEEVAELIEYLPIEILNVDKELVKLAAIKKASGGVSYADCFVLAMAEILKGKVVTGDPEFKKLKDKINLLWVG